jgi:hypothetical protein
MISGVVEKEMDHPLGRDTIVLIAISSMMVLAASTVITSIAALMAEARQPLDPST